MKNLSLRVARADGMPGFAAYLSGTAKEHGKMSIDLGENQAIILLDIEATFDDSCILDEDGGAVERTLEEKKRDLIQGLMHEFGHAMEDFFDTTFDEDWIERVTESYETRTMTLSQSEQERLADGLANPQPAPEAIRDAMAMHEATVESRTDDPIRMDPRYDEACDVLNACVFVGEMVNNPENRKGFKQYLERWNRAAKEADENQSRMDESDSEGQ